MKYSTWSVGDDSSIPPPVVPGVPGELHDLRFRGNGWAGDSGHSSHHVRREGNSNRQAGLAYHDDRNSFL